jgi:beta-glucuronidase
MRDFPRFLTFCLVLLLLSTASVGQVPPLVANLEGRHSVSFNGAWHAIVDPYQTGAFDYHNQPLTNNNAFYKNHKPESKSDLVEYDFDTSATLQVPGDWNSQRESLLFYEGTIWYERSFDYPESTSRRLFLHFGAVNYTASVYLNGELLGQHEGGFTPFNFEITGRILPHDNFIVVRVDNTRRATQVPALNTDWWNYGGITRPVTLVDLPKTFIQNYFIQCTKGSTRQIAGWVQIDGPQLQQKIRITIPEAGISKTFPTDSKGRAEFSFDADLTLWSPETPKLYDVVIASDGDEVRERIGFRSIEVRGDKILLNGKPVFLRGINLHAEAPLRGGRAWSEEDARTLLSWAKELGCNFVRLAHYPHSEATLPVADQMGLMVWAEVPVYWSIDWGNSNTLNVAENQLNEMVNRDQNRASLIIYSVANETPVSDARNLFLKQLIQYTHSLDSSRLVSAALQSKEEAAHSHIAMSISDPIAGELDVIGVNEYIGWYSHKPADADTAEWSSLFNKPVIVSEFGGDALFGYHGDAQTRWSEEYQEDLYRHQIAMLKRIPFLSGVAPWVLMDFRSPRRTLPRFEDYFNHKGLITNQGEKKKAFFVLQGFYRELATREAH